MSQQTGSVTPERFASGFTFKDYLAQIKVNKNRFEEYYSTIKLSPEDITFFKKAAKVKNGVAKILVLAEEWCPDVWRGLPVMQRIAEAGGIELKVFPRDANLDIMNQFLNQGKFQSIPTVVFYTKDMQYICHWIERPAVAYEERAGIEAAIKKEMPNASDQELHQAIRERTQKLYPSWQQATVKEIRQLLTGKLKV